MLQQAIALHQSGQVARAEAAYRQILSIQPQNPDALHGLGVLAHQTGRPADGLELVQRAVALAPKNGIFLNSLGNILRDSNQPDAAVTAYRAALKILPNMPELHLHLGLAQAMLGQVDRAESAFRNAIRLKRDFNPARLELGNLLVAAGRPKEAESVLRAALRTAPSDPVLLNAIGLSQVGQGDQSAALQSFEQALSLRPDYLTALANRAQALLAIDQLEAAAAGFRAVLRLAPNDPDAPRALGDVLVRLERPAEALPFLEIATARAPENADIWHMRGLALRDMGRWVDALPCFAEAVRIKPEDPETRSALAHAQLVLGDFDQGWRNFAWRVRKPGNARLAEPAWDGAATDKTVLIHAEQGLGDSIQFARFLAEAGRRARLILGVPPALSRLLAGFPGVADLVDHDPLPPYTYQCPLMSLPLVLGVPHTDFAAIVPYLRPDPVRLAEWQARLAGLDRPRIGLVWAGNPKFPADHQRSIAADLLAPLLEVPGVNWVSLQIGPAAAERPIGVADFTDALVDLTDTAALIAALDLVIAVDTAVAHLAGALGKPIWLLNRANTDWRWLAAADASPWYPTMRIFRQTRPGNWPEVIDRVATELRAGQGRAMGL